MDIIKAYATKNLCYIAARKMTPQGIVVHSTGANNPNLKRYVDCPREVGVNRYNNHWNQPKPGGATVCVHAFIGYDINGNVRVAEILPLDICCWGVGSGRNGSYNYAPAYIQFEICEDGLQDRAYYDRAFGVAADYAAHLCETLCITPDRVVGHCEAHKEGYGSNHSDPEHWMKKFGETMADFRRAVSERLRERSCNGQEKSDDANGVTDASSPLTDGDLVSIAADATYYDGKFMPAWVKAYNWYVKGMPVGDRVVIDQNEDRTHSICSPVNRRYLTALKKASDDSIVGDSSDGRCPYRVRVTNVLNIRKAPGTNSVKTGCITDRGVYTIVEERTGIGASLWGRLKSGAGWIALDYTERL